MAWSCLRCTSAPSQERADVEVIRSRSGSFEGKEAIWLIEGKDGSLLAEFYGPKGVDEGMCSYNGGRFKTGFCPFKEWLAKANTMAGEKR